MTISISCPSQDHWGERVLRNITLANKRLRLRAKGRRLKGRKLRKLRGCRREWEVEEGEWDQGHPGQAHQGRGLHPRGFGCGSGGGAVNEDAIAYSPASPNINVSECDWVGELLILKAWYNSINFILLTNWREDSFLLVVNIFWSQLIFRNLLSIQTEERFLMDVNNFGIKLNCSNFILVFL